MTFEEELAIWLKLPSSPERDRELRDLNWFPHDVRDIKLLKQLGDK